MAYRDLRAFLQALEENGELKRIPFEADPVLEIAEFADRSVKSGGPALLFEKPKGHDIPVLINAFASMRRMEIALEVGSVEQVARRIVDLLEMRAPEGLMGKLKMLPKLAEMGSFFPRTVSAGACQEVVRTEGFSLRDLPALQCWPEDGGRFITLPLVFSRNPDTGKRNCGMYRMQIFDDRTAGMHWQTHKQGAEHYRRAGHLGHKRMDVAVAIGADPVTMYSAILPLPPDLDEMIFAGFLRQRPVEMVKCRTSDLEVPANAEIVLEGYVELGELRTEGPFGDHTGFYSLADWYPAFNVTAITHRKDPIYPTTIVGKPPMEDYFFGKATERIFLPLLQMIVPDIIDYTLPISGAFHNCAYVKIQKEYPMQARRVMHAIWGAGQMSFTKFIIVVDEDVDIHDEQQVLFHLFANCDPQRDSEIVHGPVDILDHASPEHGLGSKIGFDATRKWAGEGRVRRWPKELEMDVAIKELVTRKWKEYGL